ncbi:hypothetical protein [Methylobacterium sp. J-072]|nr:hypothetical protein [Methylobacterium sp. J-072]
MPKHITVAIPHDFGAADVIRRLDQQIEWALQWLERENISVTMTA